MKIAMKVFSVEPRLVEVDATLADGTAVKAVVDGKHVQLTSAEHGTLALNLVGADAEGWKIPAGSDVTVTIE